MGIFSSGHNGRACCNSCKSFSNLAPWSEPDHKPQYQCALEEWRSGHFVQKKFEAEKYNKVYVNIRDYVIERLEHDPRAEDALDRLSSWAGDSYVSPSSSLSQSLTRLGFISEFVLGLPEGTAEE